MVGVMGTHGSRGKQTGSSLRWPRREAATSFAFDGTAGVTSGVEFFSVFDSFYRTIPCDSAQSMGVQHYRRNR